MRPKEVAPTLTKVLGLIWPVPLTVETRSSRTALAVVTAGTSERLWRTVPATTPATTTTMTTISRIFLPVMDAFYRRILLAVVIFAARHTSALGLNNHGYAGASGSVPLPHDDGCCVVGN